MIPSHLPLMLTLVKLFNTIILRPPRQQLTVIQQPNVSISEACTI